VECRAVCLPVAHKVACLPNGLPKWLQLKPRLKLPKRRRRHGARLQPGKTHSSLVWEAPVWEVPVWEALVWVVLVWVVQEVDLGRTDGSRAHRGETSSLNVRTRIASLHGRSDHIVRTALLP
jgi:hypothetical protein